MNVHSEKLKLIEWLIGLQDMATKLYKIIYLIAKPIIFITDIFDTRQDPDKMKP